MSIKLSFVLLQISSTQTCTDICPKPATAVYVGQFTNFSSKHHFKILNFRRQNLLIKLSFVAGIINTDLHRHMYKTWYGWLCWPVHQFFVKTPFYGAQTTLYCCLSDSISSGGYYSDCRKKSPSQRTSDDRACKKLWDVSEKMVGLRSSQSEMLWFWTFNEFIR